MDQEIFCRVSMIIFAAILYTQCTITIAQLILHDISSVAVKRMLLSGGLFAALVVGCLAFSETTGMLASACFAASFCITSLVALPLFSHRWRQRDSVRTQALFELNKTVTNLQYALKTNTTPATLCARAAKEHNLTRREEEVLLLLCCGRSYAEIAEELYLSLNTIKSHIRSLYKKIGTVERAELSKKIVQTKEQRQPLNPALNEIRPPLDRGIE